MGTCLLNPWQDFEVDEASEEYLSRHAHSLRNKKRPSLIEEHFEPVLEDEQEGDDGPSDSDAPAGSASPEDLPSSSGRSRAKKTPRWDISSPSSENMLIIMMQRIII